MPKIKEANEAITRKKLCASIRYYMTYYGITPKELAICAHIGVSTLYARLRNPEQFSLGELQRIAAKFKLAVNDLLKEAPSNDQTA